MELRGADFDWDNWAGLPEAELAARRAAAAALLRDEVRPSLFRRLGSCLRLRKAKLQPEQGAWPPAIPLLLFFLNYCLC